MKGYILNDYERSISIKNLKSIIGNSYVQETCSRDS